MSKLSSIRSKIQDLAVKLCTTPVKFANPAKTHNFLDRADEDKNEESDNTVVYDHLHPAHGIMNNPQISFNTLKGDFLNLSSPKRRLPKPLPVQVKARSKKKLKKKSKKLKQNLTVQNMTLASPPTISDKDPVLLNLYSKSFINLLTRPRYEQNNSNSYLNSTYHPLREYYRNDSKTKVIDARYYRHCA